MSQEVSDNKLVIQYTGTARTDAMSVVALEVLHDVCATASVSKITITSTRRTVEDQARIMFQEARLRGVSYMYGLYASAGRQVISVYEELHRQNRSDDEIRLAMAMKMRELGPERISNHIVGAESGLCVFDIAPSSIVPSLNTPQLIVAIEAHPRVKKFFKPPRDKAFHLEIAI